VSDDPSRYWLGIEEPFPWLLCGLFSAGGIALAALGAFVAIEVIDGFGKFCQ
jgi:hypothetical protein